MKTFMRVAVVAIVAITLVGCGGGGDSITDKVQAGVAKSCGFLAEYQWLRDIVSKMDITAATINTAVTVICDGVNAKPQIGLLSKEKTCPHGQIVINGEVICIEGEKIDP